MRGQSALDQIGLFAFVVIIAMAVVVGLNMFYGEIFATYGITNSSNATSAGFESSFNKLNASANSIGNDLRQSNSAGANPYLVLFSGGYDALKQVFNILDALRDLGSGIIDFLSTVAGVNVGPIVYLLLGALVFWFSWKFLEAIVGR